MKPTGLVHSVQLLFATTRLIFLLDEKVAIEKV